MNIVSAEFKEAIRKLFDRLSSPEDPSASMGPTEATAVLTGPQTSEARWPNFTLVSDEPKSVGGNDSAPTPSSIFVASIGFAENVIFARQAAIYGVEFDTLETRVEAQWDRKGMFGIRGADPFIFSWLIETRVTTTADPGKMAELVRLTDKRSPMTTTVARAATIRRRLLVNGKETPV